MGDWDGIPVTAVGWAALALGVLGVAAAALSWFKPPTLTLSSTGFAMATVVKTSEIRWDQIERFFFWSPSPARKQFVGYTKRGRVGSALQNVNRTLGADGAIPDQYDLSTTEMLDLLESSRAYWTRTGDAAG